MTSGTAGRRRAECRRILLGLMTAVQELGDDEDGEDEQVARAFDAMTADLQRSEPFDVGAASLGLISELMREVARWTGEPQDALRQRLALGLTDNPPK